MNRIKCTDEQIINASNNTKSARQAALLLGIKYDTYKSHALRLGCFKTNQGGKGTSKPSRHKSGYEFNYHYFEHIDSIEKAYFLGFIAADGTIVKNCVRININRRDKDLLINLCNAIGYDEKHIHDYMSYYKDNDGKKHEFPACRLCLSSMDLSSDLAKYNIIPNKSEIDIDLFSNIPDKFKMAWCVGYIDGDGHISDNNYLIEIASNYKTITSIAEFFQSSYNILNQRTKQIGNITYTLSYHRKHDVAKLLMLYLFGSSMHLKRKYDAAQCCLDCYIKLDIIQRKYYKNKCIDCGNIVSNNAIRCRSCYAKYLSNLKQYSKPNRNELKELIRHCSFTEIGKLYGVSDNAVKKWCKNLDLPYRKRDIFYITDIEWEKI